MTKKIEAFEKDKQKSINSFAKNAKLKGLGLTFIKETAKNKYTYNFSWLGRPIIQFPQDIVAIQEIIWKIKPDIILETGIAHGGSLVLSASILELLGGDRFVIGVDIDIREYNRIQIESHPLAKRIKMIQGSSVDKETISKVFKSIPNGRKVMVILDSNHTHKHVMMELNAYSKLVSKDSYLIVFDTVIEDTSDQIQWGNRPWGKGNNPKTAVSEFLKKNKQFEIDKEYDSKLLISVAPNGYLKRIC